MKIESERKFIVKGAFPQPKKYNQISQLYIYTSSDMDIRIRWIYNPREDLSEYRITMKAGGSKENRIEVDEEITRSEYRRLADSAYSYVRKTRLYYEDGVTVDEFDSSGLTLLEVESPAKVPECAKDFEEVTGNPDYYNANMAVKL